MYIHVCNSIFIYYIVVVHVVVCVLHVFVYLYGRTALAEYCDYESINQSRKYRDRLHI